jgi:YggT family protein
MAILYLLIDLLILLILVRAVLSWLPLDSRNSFVQFIQRITDPILEPIRKTLGIHGGIDFSPLVAILILIVLQRLLAGAF